MAKVKFPIREIEKIVKLTPENQEKISLFGTTIESIDKETIELEISANRPDLLSQEGFKRAIGSFFGKTKGIKKYQVKPSKYIVKVDSSVKDVRPYTVCAVVKNLKLSNEDLKEVINLQEKLHTTIGRNRKKVAIGIYPLEKISMPITYKAADPRSIKFRPLGANTEMNASQIIQKHPLGLEYGKLLKDSKKYPVFIDSKDKVMSMPPIINSEETGRVDTSTKEVFIECSGNNLQALEVTLNILVTALSDLGGEIYSVQVKDKKVETYPRLKNLERKIDLDHTNKIIGIDLTEKELKPLLEKMGHEYSNKKVIIPPWRYDILNEVDLIEDIAIAYGYENLSPEVPAISTIAKQSKESVLQNKVAEILIGLGLLEISTHHLIKENEISGKAIRVLDSRTEYKALRPNLLIPGMRVLSENTDKEYPQKIFEIGKVFRYGETETGVEETENLFVALSPANFTNMKEILDYLFNMLNLEYSIEHTKKEGLIEGRTGKIMLDKKDIGYIGEMHPNSLKDWNLKMPASVIEINLTEVYQRI